MGTLAGITGHITIIAMFIMYTGAMESMRVFLFFFKKKQNKTKTQFNFNFSFLPFSRSIEKIF